MRAREGVRKTRALGRQEVAVKIEQQLGARPAAHVLEPLEGRRRRPRSRGAGAGVRAWNHRDIELEIYGGVRETYDGPLTMADDLTVLNVTKDHIEVREVTFNHESWPQGTSKEWDTAPRGEPATGLMQEWRKEGTLEGLNPPPTQPID